MYLECVLLFSFPFSFSDALNSCELLRDLSLDSFSADWLSTKVGASKDIVEELSELLMLPRELPLVNVALEPIMPENTKYQEIHRDHKFSI